MAVESRWRTGGRTDERGHVEEAGGGARRTAPTVEGVTERKGGGEWKIEEEKDLCQPIYRRSAPRSIAPTHSHVIVGPYIGTKIHGADLQPCHRAMSGTRHANCFGADKC